MPANFVTSTAQDLYGLGSSGTKNPGSIKIYSFSTNEIISFNNVFSINFSETYQLGWTPTEVYGRMDPIATYKNTKRRINLSFELISDGQKTISNKLALNVLKKSLYPVYTNDLKGGAIISSPPMFRVKWNSVVSNINADEKTDDGDTLKGGVLCYMDSFELKPSVLQGNGWAIINGNLIPKIYNINLGLNVIHEHPLGNSFFGKISVPRVTISTAAKGLTSDSSNNAISNTQPVQSAASVSSTGTTPSPAAPTNSLNDLTSQAAVAVASSGQPTEQQTSAQRYANAKEGQLTNDIINDIEGGVSQATINSKLQQYINKADDGTIKAIFKKRNIKAYKKTIDQLIKMAQQDDNYKGVDFSK